MSNQNLNRIIISGLLVLVLLCACVCAMGEGEPTLRFESNEISVAVKKTAKVSPVAEHIENPKKLKYTWTSGDEQIATVRNGTVKGIAPGETTVTCTAELPEGKQLSASLKVRVVEPVKTLKIGTKANTPVNVGEKLAVEYTIQPETATDKSLTWESSDPAIATVDSQGMVTGVAPGNVTISAMTNDGSKKTAKVRLHVPILRCDTAEVTVDKPEGATFPVDYFGNDWDSNVTVKADGDFYEYAAECDGNKVSVWVSAGSEGTGKLTFRDKKFPQAAVSVSVIATKSGIAMASLVEIEDVKVRNGIAEYTVKNNGSQDIIYIVFIVIPRDQDGNIQYKTEASRPEDSSESVFSPFYKRLRPGKSAKESFRSEGYPNATQWDVAVSFIRLADGTRIVFNEESFRWFSSSEKKYINRPAGRNNCIEVSDEIYQKAKTIKLGFEAGPEFLSWYTGHYGYHNTGKKVVTVEEGSVAAKAGLQPHDLIVAVNGLTYTENPYTLTIGMAEMADTGKMVLTVERRGQEGTFEVELTKE